MAAGLAVASVGYALARRRPPLLNSQSRWPTKTDIDRPLVAGAALFGIGWGLVGLCPGPAIANLGTLAPGVIVFVIAMVIGMVTHDLRQSRATALAARNLASRPLPTVKAWVACGISVSAIPASKLLDLKPKCTSARVAWREAGGEIDTVYFSFARIRSSIMPVASPCRPKPAAVARAGGIP